MSLRQPIFLLLLLGQFLGIQAQSLPLSPQFEQAVKKGTRTLNGAPGPAYWQNHAEYKIKANLDPKTRLLKGNETVVYTNNSPDTLDRLVIRLYPDIFKRDAPRDGSQAIDPADLNDTGVILSKLAVNGKPVAKYERKGTNLFLSLPSPLATRAKLRLDISWQYTIPGKTHIREGTYFETSFFVAYWYPQVAVYDDVYGWDELNYTGQQEFYNDFNQYEVEITMPSSHLVWATGVWQNPEQVLSAVFLERYRRGLVSDSVVQVLTEADRKEKKFSLPKAQHTYRFKAEKVPDFAFTASDTYLWDMASVVVDDSTQRRTAVGAAYHPNSKDFYSVARYAQQCVDYFSHQLPGVPFPYPNLTVFNGDGGMEFPMLVNDGSFGDTEAVEVTAHEIAHTYFPFYMGINERRFAWMDEGWAQTLPNDMEFLINKQRFRPQQQNALYFLYLAASGKPAPLMTPSYELVNNSYANASYFHPSQAYTLLKNWWGTEEFRRILKQYMASWNGKHPQPWDFFFSFDKAAGQDLSWYWKPWFFESGIPDLAIKEVRPRGEGAEAVIQKLGLQPIPIRLQVEYKDGKTEILQKDLSVWKDGQTEVVISLPQMPTKVTIGGSQIPDNNPKNNQYPR
jgi:hypothetical protein